MIRVRSVWSGVAGAPYYSNFFFDAGNAGGQEQAAADKVRDFLFGLSGAFDNALTVTIDSDVPTIDPATGDITGVEPTTTVAVVGTDTAEALPPFTQAVVNWNTGTFNGGRRLRGKFFMPGLTETSNSATGTPTGTFNGALVTEVDAFLTGGPALCVWSRTYGVAATVAGYNISPQWGVLRSRRD